MTARMSVRNALTFFFDGRVRNFPLYLRTCCPRKSNPSSMCVILVFSSESSKPRSRRKSVTRGLTSVASISCEMPVIMKSSQYRTRLTCLFMPLSAFGPDFGYFLRSIRSSPSRAILARTGLLSPPTKLQTFFFGIVITRIWVDPKHDIDFVTRDFDPLDQRSDEVAFARPVGHLQPVVQFGSKVLQPANNELQFPLQGRLLCQRLALLFQPGETLTQAGDP